MDPDVKHGSIMLENEEINVSSKDRGNTGQYMSIVIDEDHGTVQQGQNSMLNDVK